jgi:hypothetical protein
MAGVTVTIGLLSGLGFATFFICLLNLIIVEMLISRPQTGSVNGTMAISKQRADDDVPCQMCSLECDVVWRIVNCPGTSTVEKSRTAAVYCNLVIGTFR